MCVCVGVGGVGKHVDDLWSFLGVIYALNVCVPPKFIYCNPNPQCDSIYRWDLWEAIRFR